MVGRDERSSGDAGEGLEEVQVAVRRTVVDQHRPLERGGRQRPVELIDGAAGEGDDVADLPQRRAGRRRDGDVRRRMSGVDGDRRTARSARAGDLQTDRDVGGRRIGELRGGGRGVAVDAVAVQVPAVRDRPAQRIARRAAVEADRQRQEAVRPIGLDHRGRPRGGGVLDATDRAAVEVDVVEVAAGADLQIDWRPPAALAKRGACLWIGLAARVRAASSRCSRASSRRRRARRRTSRG